MKVLSLLLGVGLLGWAACLRGTLYGGVPAPWSFVVAIALGGLGWVVAWACMSLGAGPAGHLQDTTLDKLVGNTMFAPLSPRQRRARR